MALIFKTIGFVGKGWIRWCGDGEWLLFGDGPWWWWSPCEGSPGSIVDEPGLVVELLNLSVIGVDEINNLLDGHEAFPFLLNECADCCPFIVICKEHTGGRWLAAGRRTWDCM